LYPKLNTMEKKILTSLKSFGFKGKTVTSAISFCEDKIDEYWVDCPVEVRNDGEKEYAEYCNLFKSYKKILSRLNKKK